MINRVKLPKEDEFLEIASGDRDDFYKAPEKSQPKCTCSCSDWKMVLAYGAIWGINQL